MIKKITPFPNPNRLFSEWCDHCKKGPDKKNIRNFYFVDSDNEKLHKQRKGTIVLCNCCLDMALNEQGILPEEF